MRKVQLSNGKWVRAGVKFSTLSSNEVPLHILKRMSFGVDHVRVTLAYLKEGERNPTPGQKEEALLEVIAYCSPEENFCSADGRKAAANKLIAAMKSNPSLSYQPLNLGDIKNLKEDRRKVFLLLCPEFEKGAALKREISKMAKKLSQLMEKEKDANTN